jgi:capsular polysaccharide biosynthesis protein
MKRIILMAIGLIAGNLLTGCVSVKAYQKMYLNDTDMALSQQKAETFETNFETYREGAAGANGGKVGGGCGCN